VIEPSVIHEYRRLAPFRSQGEPKFLGLAKH